MPGGLARGTKDKDDAELLAGDQAYRKGDLKAAAEHYRAAARLAPEDPAPAVGAVRVKLANGDVPAEYGAGPDSKKVAALVADISKLVTANPDYGPAYVERGRLLLVQAKADAALADLQRGASAFPRRSGSRVRARSRARRDGQVGSRRGTPAPRRGARSGVVRALHEPRLGAHGARGRAGRAHCVSARGRLNPNDARTLADLGTALVSANAAPEAKQYLERAVALEPGRAAFLTNLGYVGAPSSATRRRRRPRCRRLSPPSAKLGSAWLNLANALASEGKFDDAERACKKAEAIDSTDPRVKSCHDDVAELRRR